MPISSISKGLRGRSKRLGRENENDEGISFSESKIGEEFAVIQVDDLIDVRVNGRKLLCEKARVNLKQPRRPKTAAGKAASTMGKENLRRRKIQVREYLSKHLDTTS